MDLHELAKRPGFAQAFSVDKTGKVDARLGDEKFQPNELLRFRDGSAALGERLGLGRLIDLAANSGAAAVFMIDDDGTLVTGVFGTAGDSLDDRAREMRALLDPNGGSPVVRRFGFTEVRR